MHFDPYQFSDSEELYNFVLKNQNELSEQSIYVAMMELVYKYQYKSQFWKTIQIQQRYNPEIEYIIQFANNITKINFNKMEDCIINMCKVNRDYTYIIEFLEKVPKANFEKIQKVILEYGTEQEKYEFIKSISNANLDLFKDCFKENIVLKYKYDKLLKDNKAMNKYTVEYANDFNEVIARCKEHGLMEGDFPFDKTSIRDSYIRFCNSAKEDKSIEAFIKMLVS